MSVCLSGYMSVSLNSWMLLSYEICFCLSVSHCLSQSIIVCLTVCWSVFLLVCPSCCLSVFYLSVCLSVWNHEFCILMRFAFVRKCLTLSVLSSEQMIQKQRDAGKKKRAGRQTRRTGKSNKEQRLHQFSELSWRERNGAGQVHTDATRLTPGARTMLVWSFRTKGRLTSRREIKNKESEENDNWKQKSTLWSMGHFPHSSSMV